MIGVVIIFICLIVAYFVDKYWHPKSNESSAIDNISSYMSVFNFLYKNAETFVAYAREFMEQSTGREKFSYVFNKLISLYNRYGSQLMNNTNIDTNTFISGIIQKAYDDMISKDRYTVLSSEEEYINTSEPIKEVIENNDSIDKSIEFTC